MGSTIKSKSSKKAKNREYTVEELYNPKIDTGWDVDAYARQSTKEQLVKNIHSHISQTIELLRIIREELGFRDDGTTGKVTLWLENQIAEGKIKNASGTWPIDRRLGLKAILKRVQEGWYDEVAKRWRKTKLIVAEFVDRLFRDEDRIDSNIFIKTCKENGCLVYITSKKMLYNFANPQHAEMFRLEVMMGAAYIENHVHGTMLRRRDLAVKNGLWAGVGSILIGYVVDKKEGGETYGRLIIYEPHAKVIRWIFERFIKLGYDFSALYRELRGRSLFPPFELTDAVTKTMLKQGGDGWFQIRSRWGLRNLLINTTYIGRRVVNGHRSFEKRLEIIDEEIFWSVYDSLEEFRPDGLPTGKVKLVRYTQETKQLNREPLVKDLIISRVGYSENRGWGTKRFHYKLLMTHPNTETEVLYCIGADEFEGHIVKRLFDKLKERKIEDLDKARKRRREEHTKRLKEIERDLAVINEENDNLLHNMAKIRIPQVVKQIEQQIARIIERKEKLEEEKEKIEHSYEEVALGTLEVELKHVEASWDQKPFHLKKALLTALIKGIEWIYLSPRFYKLKIEWRYKEWGIEEAVIDRGVRGCKPWTEEERQIIRVHYPLSDTMEILKLLPTRGWTGIVCEAHKMGVKREKRGRVSDLKLSYADMSYLDVQGITLDNFSGGNCGGWSILSSLVTTREEYRKLVVQIRIILNPEP